MTKKRKTKKRMTFSLNNMLLLFEGVDKSGKTTLITKFRELSGMPVFKNLVKPTNDRFEIGRVNGVYIGAYQLACLGNEDYIFDRSHITEQVYSKVKRGYEPEEKYWSKWEEENKHRVFTVFVDTPSDILARRFKEDKEEYVNIEEIEDLQKMYKAYIEKSPLSLIYIEGKENKQRMLTQLVVQLQNLGIWTALRSR